MYAICLFKCTRELGIHLYLWFASIWGHPSEINLRLTEDQFFFVLRSVESKDSEELQP